MGGYNGAAGFLYSDGAAQVADQDVMNTLGASAGPLIASANDRRHRSTAPSQDINCVGGAVHGWCLRLD